MNFIIIMLIILTFVSRIIGMAREVAIAYFYGATNVSDAYFMSISIPTIIITFVIVSLATSYIPVYQKLEDDNDAKNIFTNKVMGITLVICLLILIVTLMFTSQIVSLFAVGFDSETVKITVMLTRITLFAVFFMGLNHILHSFMQVKEKILLASLSGLPFNLIATLFIIISAYTSLYMLAIGTVIAIGIQCLYLLVLAKRQSFKLRPHFDMQDGNIRNLITLTLPLVLTNTVDQIGLIVDKNLASTFGSGAISSLTYATRTTTAISAVFVTSILIFTFPKIAKQAADKDMTKMKNSLAESIVTMSLFIIPVIAATAMFAHPVILLLFGRGAFDSYAVAMTSSLLFFSVFFLFGSGIFQLVARVFYALEDSKTPMIVAMVKVIVNIMLSFILIPFMDIAGLALATSVSSFVGMLLLLFLLRRKIGSLRLRNTLISLNKLIGASITMAFGSYFFYQFLISFNAMIALLVTAIIGIGIYTLLVLVLRIREVEILIAFILKRILAFIHKSKYK